MTEGVVIFLGGAAFGAAIGFLLALDRFMRKEQPVIELRVTPELASKLAAGMVGQWLEQHGLTWMPKGPDFKAKVRQ